MGDRYIITHDSSNEICSSFMAEVVDTDRNEKICVCYEPEDAVKIANALNKTYEEE